MAAKVLRIVLPCLPDLASVGGNARPGNYYKAGTNAREDRAAWYLAIREALGPPPYPHFIRAKMQVTVRYPDRRRRDKDNIIRALKHMRDALCPGGMRSLGCGILSGDDVTVLDDSYEVELGCEKGETIIEIQEASYHSQM